MKAKVDIIIPVYYEERNITEVLDGIKRYVKTPHRILAIWQDKKDPTLSILKALSNQYSELKLLESKQGVGVVKALVTGYQQARAPYIVTMMADLSDDPKDIDKIVALLQKGCDVVSASRYLSGGRRVGGPKVKGLLSFFACWTLSTLFRFPTTDATNAFRGLRKEYLDSITIESKGGFELPLEITVKAYTQNRRIGEIATIWTERKSGKSKFKLFEWLPHYLRWYLLVVNHSLRLRKTARKTRI